MVNPPSTYALALVPLQAQYLLALINANFPIKRRIAVKWIPAQPLGISGGSFRVSKDYRRQCIPLVQKPDICIPRRRECGQHQHEAILISFRGRK